MDGSDGMITLANATRGVENVHKARNRQILVNKHDKKLLTIFFLYLLKAIPCEVVDDNRNICLKLTEQFCTTFAREEDFFAIYWIGFHDLVKEALLVR